MFCVSEFLVEHNWEKDCQTEVVIGLGSTY